MNNKNEATKSKNQCGFNFIDETGVLHSDPRQRFFGIGCLEITDTAEFYNELSGLYHKILSRIEAKRKQRINGANLKNFKDLLKDNKRFEFKFNRLDKISLDDYEKLIRLYLKYNLKFLALVIDTNKFLQKDSWQAYLKYAKDVLRIENNSSQIVIADYLDKPKSSEIFFEKEINKLDSVINTCRVESDACLFVQLVDVLLGSVVYDYKLKYYKLKYIFAKEDENQPKTQMVHLLRKGLQQKSLCGVDIKNKFIVKEFL